MENQEFQEYILKRIQKIEQKLFGETLEDSQEKPEQEKPEQEKPEQEGEWW